MPFEFAKRSGKLGSLVNTASPLTVQRTRHRVRQGLGGTVDDRGAVETVLYLWPEWEK